MKRLLLCFFSFFVSSQFENLPQETGLFTDAYNERFFIEDRMVFHVTVNSLDSTAEVDQTHPSVSLKDLRIFKSLREKNNGTPFALLTGYVGVSNG